MTGGRGQRRRSDKKRSQKIRGEAEEELGT